MIDRNGIKTKILNTLGLDEIKHGAKVENVIDIAIKTIEKVIGRNIEEKQYSFFAIAVEDGVYVVVDDYTTIKSINIQNATLENNRIIVQAGTYTGTVVLDFSGNLDNEVLLYALFLLGRIDKMHLSGKSVSDNVSLSETYKDYDFETIEKYKVVMKYPTWLFLKAGEMDEI